MNGVCGDGSRANSQNQTWNWSITCLDWSNYSTLMQLFSLSFTLMMLVGTIAGFERQYSALQYSTFFEEEKICAESLRLSADT